MMNPECPFGVFQLWYQKAEAEEINDPNAATLSTVDERGRPSSRIILVKQVDQNGFAFFTNYTSTKARHLTERPFASLCFHWKSLRVQVRIEGMVHKRDASASDAYFATRSRESRIGAHASLQSQTLPDRAVLERRFADVADAFVNQEVPRPEHWGGFLLIPETMEFWQDQPHRLHHRLVYDKCRSTTWETRLLYP
ncbi:MAG: pyridoxamine 5'-phosphate oxidase [Alphaproteobacteria bacterium]